MAANETELNEEKPPEKRPFSPGVLMVLGLFLLVIAAWCGYDVMTKEDWAKEGKTGTILMNWIGLVPFGIGGIYAFVLAAVRSKRGAAEPPAPASPPPGDAEGGPAGEPEAGQSDAKPPADGP